MESLSDWVDEAVERNDRLAHTILSKFIELITNEDTTNLAPELWNETQA